jgi:hypothetical protein
MVMGPEAVVDEYFSRVRGGGISMVELFHDDAVLIGLGARREGRDAIREFYQGVVERAGPSPTLVGPLLVRASRVAAEISINLADGQVVHALDLFVVEEGLIRSLTYFLSAHPAPTSGGESQ